jgi:CheY-like chemotaxis protein
MSKKVLIFESDASFAGELRGGFARLGCDVTVVEDSTQGLQAAARDRPDLILLTVELPRSNGFSVCNKLKRDAGLQAVPVLILSSDSTEETFDHHRRLRGRADDYVKKPVAFDELLERAKKFVTFDGFAGETDPASGAAIVSDDEILIDELDVLPSNGAGAPESSSVSADDVVEVAPVSIAPPSLAPAADDAIIIDSVSIAPVSVAPVSDAPVSVAPVSVAPGEAELESVPLPGPASELAHDSGDDAPTIGVQALVRPATVPPSVRPVSRAPSQAPRASDGAEAARFREEIERQKARIRELEESERAAAARAAELDEQLRRGAGRDAEVQRLQRELDEAKAKGASGKSTGSAREFLDLREQLNKKDKEILELRDQLTHKDKGLLALRDGQLGLEREKADLVDRIGELEKSVADASKREEAAKNDKDQASKRAEDFKRKGEKIKVDLDAALAELAEKRGAYENEIAQRDAREAALRSDLEEGKRRAEAELEAAVQTTEEQGKKQLAEALSQARAEAEAERARAEEAARETARAEAERAFGEKLAEASRAHDDALAKLRAEAEAAADESRHQRDDLTNRISALEAELQAEREQGAAERTRAASVASRVEKLETELRAASDELESFRDTAAQRAKSIQKLENSLEASRSEADNARKALVAEQEKLARWKSRFDANDAALEKAKDALAAVLARIEEAQKRDE